MKASDNTPLGINFQCYDAVEVCMAIEREGISFYEQAAKKVGDPKVRDIFRRLAREEKEHSRLLQSKGKYLQPALSKRSPINEEVVQFIQNEVKGKVFPLIDGKIADIPHLQTDVDAVQFGIESETRSIQILGSLLEAERKIDVRAVFSHLMAEEKKHLAALEQLKGELTA